MYRSSVTVDIVKTHLHAAVSLRIHVHMQYAVMPYRFDKFPHKKPTRRLCRFRNCPNRLVAFTDDAELLIFFSTLPGQYYTTTSLVNETAFFWVGRFALDSLTLIYQSLGLDKDPSKFGIGYKIFYVV